MNRKAAVQGHPKQPAKLIQRTSIALLIALIMTGGSPWSTAPKVAAASFQELRITAGSRSALVNGEALSLTRTPFISQGTLMVPLSVFTKAFGAVSRLENGDVVRITRGSSTVVLTLNSPVIWTKTNRLTTRGIPLMVNGTLMVPLRAVAEGLGADISSARDGLVVKLLEEPGDEEDGATGHQNDQTRVGNSYYQWSMNLPSGWVPGNSGDESVATFTDTTGTLYMEIHAVPQKTAQDQESLLDDLVQVARSHNETILHEETVTTGKNPYARIIASDNDRTLWEERLYYADGRVYAVYLSDSAAEQYQDLDKHSGLLNSFEPAFDRQNPNIEDLSRLQEGYKEASIASYGISLRILAEWSSGASGTDFTGPDRSLLHFSVSSVPKGGQTLLAWVEELKQDLARLYVKEAYRYQEPVSIQVSGEQGMLFEYNTLEGLYWVRHAKVLLIQDGYRYLINYDGPLHGQTNMTNQGEKTHATLDELRHIVDSVDIDFDMVKSTYGTIEDRSLVMDKTLTLKKLSDNYGYHMDIPRYWTPVADQYDQPTIEYRFPGGSFRLNVKKTSDPELTIWQLRSLYTEAAKSDKSFVLQSVENIKVDGAAATVFHVHQSIEGVPVSKQVSVIHKDGIVYKLTVQLNDTNATEEQKAAVKKAIESFGWIK